MWTTFWGKNLVRLRLQHVVVNENKFLLKDIREMVGNGYSVEELAKSKIPDKRVGTRCKFSPLPTFNVDNQVIFALLVGKNVIFSNIDQGGRGNTRYSSSVPTTFGRDCLKEICEEFSSEGNASDCHGVTLF